MKFMKRCVTLLAASALVGCATSQTVHIQAIGSSRIQNVVDDMKRQVSVYVAYQNSPQGTASVIRASATKPCGNGLIDFDIKSVKLEVLTTLESTVGGGIEAGPMPIGGTTTISGGASGGRTVSNIQELVLAADMLPNRSFVYAGKENVRSAPIAGSLINLRDALIRAGEVGNRVCFKTKPKSNDGNTYKLAVSIENTAGGSLSLGLAPLVVTASGETRSTTGNTLTVSFEPHEFSSREIGNVRRSGSRGAVPNVKDAGVWSLPVTPPGAKQGGAGNDCPSGDPNCTGVFNKGDAAM
ncbi:hypothetical protein KEM44_29940 [Sinorhizobium meliloti]|uniref:hypothetical protein n=1 Tax=Rhizobium meliloti TaxID=382 RepID=UPI002006A1A4|nr:hypothetical protein [Sinorhizobium meliloti]MCK3781776.1 hypothetical protein [Sinorhizobium meliloti]MCK3789597.1 hypothetical protein [Sinorhizobium meliloti]MCK3796506.1 hypothetical protein [Sinorhizobium meliloti]MDW9645880.1 hypothetical protein [Sinorhizobium meliloti]UTG97469.1 hypothetical protein KEM44_29940 [Sinorhizobium meliloti]